MDKIKVLYIDEISRIAGGENWFLNFAEGLTKNDVEPLLLCPEGPFAEAARSKGIHVMPYNFRFNDLSSHKILTYLLFLIFRIWDSFAISRIVKKEKIDIIHSINTNGHVISSLIKTVLSQKVIWHIHHSHQKVLYRYFKPDYMVFVAQMRQDILKEISLNQNIKRFVLYNGIDCEVYANIDTQEAIPGNIGFIGRLIPEKGVEDFVSAASLILKNHPDMQFSIFGEEIFDNVFKGTYTDTVRDIIKKSGLEEKVKLKGFVFPQTKIFSSINLFLMPSQRIGESCPMVILEAMASGVPVIASAVGGIPEIIEHGVTGYLIPPKDPQALADAVCHVINNPDEVRKIIENGRKVVKERFDYRENARQFVKIYGELLDEQR